jgi:hypothetical protein
VAEWRDEECLRLLDRARDESLELIRGTYRRARKQLHAASQAERARAQGRLAAARAELETQRRLHRQQLGSVILDAARQRLPRRLLEQWDDPRGRATWITNAVAHALARLPRGRWRIRHALHFQASDHDLLLRALRPRQLPEPELIADPRVEAGLIIESTGVRLDASSAGLLADTASTEARLLALMDTEGEPA